MVFPVGPGGLPAEVLRGGGEVREVVAVSGEDGELPFGVFEEEVAGLREVVVGVVRHSLFGWYRGDGGWWGSLRLLIRAWRKFSCLLSVMPRTPMNAYRMPQCQESLLCRLRPLGRVELALSLRRGP